MFTRRGRLLPMNIYLKVVIAVCAKYPSVKRPSNIRIHLMVVMGTHDVGVILCVQNYECMKFTTLENSFSAGNTYASKRTWIWSHLNLSLYTKSVSRVYSFCKHISEYFIGTALPTEFQRNSKFNFFYCWTGAIVIKDYNTSIAFHVGTIRYYPRRFNDSF